MNTKNMNQQQTVTAIIDNCRYCLMCRHVCPVGHVTRKETLTPHGWGLIIASVQRGMLDWDEGTVGALYSCADCGTCYAHCVTEQALPDAIAATRAQVASENLSTAIVKEVHQALKEWGNPSQKLAPEMVKDQGEVALFVGDDTKYLWPDVLESAIKLLEAAGVKPVLIGVGRSNGYLASSLGFPETARELIQTTLNELKATKAKRMLVLTPGDYYAFDRLLKERLAGEWPAEVELQEVVSLLDEKTSSGALKFKPSDDQAPFAYIDPTHSLRVPARFDVPRRLLAGVLPSAGLELFWRKERTHPCGNGALQFTNPHISEHLAYARLADAQKTGARVIVTEDPGCLSQLNKHAGRFGLRVQGFYELLAGQLL
jgi:Fe-S oxidoreductase